MYLRTRCRLGRFESMSLIQHIVEPIIFIEWNFAWNFPNPHTETWSVYYGSELAVHCIGWYCMYIGLLHIFMFMDPLSLKTAKERSWESHGRFPQNSAGSAVAKRESNDSRTVTRRIYQRQSSLPLHRHLALSAPWYRKKLGRVGHLYAVEFDWRKFCWQTHQRHCSWVPKLLQACQDRPSCETDGHQHVWRRWIVRSKRQLEQGCCDEQLYDVHRGLLQCKFWSNTKGWSLTHFWVLLLFSGSVFPLCFVFLLIYSCIATSYPVI